MPRALTPATLELDESQEMHEEKDLETARNARSYKEKSYETPQEMHEEKDLVTGVVYTRILQRNVIPAGIDGPLGDTIITSGLVYANPNFTGKPIGKYDINQLVTTISEESEHRQVTTKLSFNRKYARNSWISRLDPPFRNAKQASEVNLTGVSTFPLGTGLLPSEPFTLGIATGTGSFIGAEGTVTVAPVPDKNTFAYSFTLA